MAAGALIMEPGELPELNFNSDVRMELQSMNPQIMDEGMDLEEGELEDSDEDGEIAKENNQSSIRYERVGGAFTSGMDIDSWASKEKLDTRAKRFGGSEQQSLSKELIFALHESMGALDNKKQFNRKLHRIDALHVRGIENLSTADIFEYFEDYGPASIEWINDISCNVVWLDDIGASRSLLGRSTAMVNNSKPPPVEPVILVPDDEMDEDTADNAVNSQQPQPAPQTNELLSDKIDAASLSIPVPPGPWRVGVKYKQFPTVLLRFATHNDRKEPGAERKSRYYREHGNPNYGGMKGLISLSRKRALRGQPPTSPATSPVKAPPPVAEPAADMDKTNPWGSLAVTWSKTDDRQPQTVVDYDSYSEEEDYSSGSDSDSAWKSRLKKPKMSMYADAEEKKQKTVADLRQRIGKLSNHMGLTHHTLLTRVEEPPWRLLHGRSHSRSLSPVQIVITRSRSPSEESNRWQHDRYSGDDSLPPIPTKPAEKPHKPAERLQSTAERVPTAAPERVSSAVTRPAPRPVERVPPRPETPRQWETADIKQEPGTGHLFPIVAESSEDSSDSSSSDSSDSSDSSSEDSSESDDSSSEESSSDSDDSDSSDSEDSDSSDSSSGDSYRSRSAIREQVLPSPSPPPPGLKYRPAETISSVVNIPNRPKMKSHVVSTKSHRSHRPNKENKIPEEAPHVVRKDVPDLRNKLKKTRKKPRDGKDKADKNAALRIEIDNDYKVDDVSD